MTRHRNVFFSETTKSIWTLTKRSQSCGQFVWRVALLNHTSLQLKHCLQTAFMVVSHLGIRVFPVFEWFDTQGQKWQAKTKSSGSLLASSFSSALLSCCFRYSGQLTENQTETAVFLFSVCRDVFVRDAFVLAKAPHMQYHKEAIFQLAWR